MAASAIAEDLGSSDLLITAELAVAGCWYLEQQQRDVQHTLDGVRSHAEREVLSGKPAVVERYRQVLTLCHAFQALPPEWAIPLDPATTPFPGAALTAYARLHAPTCLLNVQILVNAVEETAADLVLTNWTEGVVTMRLRPADGSKFTTKGDPHYVEPNTAGSAGLRLNEYRRQAGGGLAVTVELHAYQTADARYGPYLAFLLPDPWQVPAVDPWTAQHQLPRPPTDTGCRTATRIPTRTATDQLTSARSIAMLRPALDGFWPLPTVIVSVCGPLATRGLVHTTPEALRLGA
jgi:hypothetical protein